MGDFFPTLRKKRRLDMRHAYFFRRRTIQRSVSTVACQSEMPSSSKLAENPPRLTALVRSDNERALRFDHGIGFVTEGRLRAYYADNVDAVVLGMLRSEFLAGPYGKEWR